MSETYPWYAFYKDTPAQLTYPAESMYGLLAKAAANTRRQLHWNLWGGAPPIDNCLALSRRPPAPCLLRG